MKPVILQTSAGLKGLKESLQSFDFLKEVWLTFVNMIIVYVNVTKEYEEGEASPSVNVNIWSRSSNGMMVTRMLLQGLVPNL